MHAPLAIFKFVAKSSLNYFLFGVGGDLAVEVLPSVVQDVWARWGKNRPEEQLRAEVEAIARLTEEQVRQQAAQAVAEEAIKFCLNPIARRSLVNEAALLGRVVREGTHPGIVRLINTALSSDPPLLVYEFVAGGELTTLIRDWHVQPPVDLGTQAARLMHQLASIVAFAHRLNPPIVHRDLKPASILLEPAGHAVRLRVANFGIGGVASAQGMGHTLPTVLSGSHTPLYASAQQKSGERPDPRDDVYALGVIWFQMLTGDLASAPGTDWRDDLPQQTMSPEMIGLLGECLASRVEKRPADAAVLAQRLGAMIRPARGERRERRDAAGGDPAQMQEIQVPSLRVTVEAVSKPQAPLSQLSPIPDDVLALEGQVEALQRAIQDLEVGVETNAPELPKGTRQRLAAAVVRDLNGTLADLCALAPEVPNATLLPFINRLRNGERARRALRQQLGLLPWWAPKDRDAARKRYLSP